MIRRGALVTTGPWLAVTVAGLLVILVSSGSSTAAPPAKPMLAPAAAVAAALSAEGPRCSDAGSLPRPAGGKCILETTVDEVTTLEVSLVKGATAEGARAAFVAELAQRGYRATSRTGEDLTFGRGDQAALVTVSQNQEDALVTVVMTRRGMR